MKITTLIIVIVKMSKGQYCEAAKIVDYNQTVVDTEDCNEYQYLVEDWINLSIYAKTNEMKNLTN